MLDSDPPALRVSWIDWDSGFRSTHLQVGDEIISVDGVSVVRPSEKSERQALLRALPGGLGEHDSYVSKGLADGDALTLTVRRRRYPGEGWQTLTVAGSVRAERSYASEQGRRAAGPTGPELLANDGFDGAWMSWLEKRVFDWSRVLDGGWNRTRVDTRTMLRDHLNEKARVDFLETHYPGPFAAAVKADWQAVHASLSGTRYELAPDALAYREIDDERVKHVTAAAKAAWQQFVSTHASEIVPAFPSVDPFREDRSRFVGKWVVLPRITPRQWLVSIDRNYLAANQSGYWYFANAASAAMRKVFAAMQRYRRFVAPNIDESVELIGRVLPDPVMAVADRRTAAGLEVEPVAALMGGTMFVDLTTDGTAEFAGEMDLTKLNSGLPADDASPRDVLEAAIAALKAGDQATWNALFADWRYVGGEGRPLYYAYYPYTPASLNEAWIRSRRTVLDSVYDVRVVWVSDVRVRLRPDAFDAAPLIEEVEAELEHLGCFDGEYRAFNSVNVHRLWTLQRRNSGPWRISSQQGI